MAREMKVEDAGGSTEGPGSTAETDATTGTGVTTSGTRPVAGGGAAGGGTTTAQLLSTYDEIEDELRAHLVRLGVQIKNVEDALQQTLLAVLRRKKGYGPVDSPSAYLFTVAANVAARFLKQQRRYVLAAGDEGDGEDRIETAAPSSRGGLFHRILCAERMQLLEKGLAELSDDDAGLIRMAHVEKLTQVKIAERLGISPNAVAQRYGRAVEELRKAVRRRCTKDDMESAA